MHNLGLAFAFSMLYSDKRSGRKAGRASEKPVPGFLLARLSAEALRHLCKNVCENAFQRT